MNLYNAATKRALKQQAKRRKSVNQLSRRANATQQQRAVQRHRDTNARGTLRASQTVEQRNAERQRNSSARVSARSSQTDEQRIAERQRDANARASARAHQTPQEREQELARRREQYAETQRQRRNEQNAADALAKPIRDSCEKERERLINEEWKSLETDHSDLEERIAEAKDQYDASVHCFKASLEDFPNHICVSCERVLHHSQGVEVSNDVAIWRKVERICKPDPNIPHRDGVP